MKIVFVTQSGQAAIVTIAGETMGFAGSPPWFVPDTPLPAVRRVVVVAPHPDDFDVIGIALRHLHEASAHIAVAVLASGSSGVEDGFVSDSSPNAKRHVREHEQAASCASFGLPAGHLHFLRLGEDEHGHLAETSANTEAVFEFLLQWEPERAFVPHCNDPNLAHQRAFAMVADSLSRQHSAATLLLNRDPKATAMRDDVYVVFDDQAAEWKRALLRHHVSQQSRNLRKRGRGFDERILNGNSETATSAGRPGAFAEAFELRTAPPRPNTPTRTA